MSLSPLEPGTVAPDFTLTNQYGEQVTLSALRGKPVVLMFFPFAFTGICTSELCAIRDDYSDFEGVDATVVSVSCDSTHTLKAFSTIENLTHSLLSDFWPHGEVSRKYGVFLEEKGMATRGTFVIDAEGVIRWSVINAPGEARSNDDYRKALAAL